MCIGLQMATHQDFLKLQMWNSLLPNEVSEKCQNNEIKNIFCLMLLWNRPNIVFLCSGVNVCTPVEIGFAKLHCCLAKGIKCLFENSVLCNNSRFECQVVVSWEMDYGGKYFFFYMELVKLKWSTSLTTWYKRLVKWYDKPVSICKIAFRHTVLIPLWFTLPAMSAKSCILKLWPLSASIIQLPGIVFSKIQHCESICFFRRTFIFLTNVVYLFYLLMCNSMVLTCDMIIMYCIWANGGK